MLKWIAVILCIILIGSMFLLVRGTATEVQADPIIGPPTIKTHLNNINAAIVFNTRIVLATLGVIGSLIICIFKITIANLKSSIGHVEGNYKDADNLLRTDIDDNTDDIKDIRKNFMSVTAHDRIGRDKGA